MKINNAIPFFAVFLLVLMGCTQDEVIKEDTSVGGKETLHSNTNLPDKAYPSPLVKEGCESLELEFGQGEIVGVNGEKISRIAAIRKIEEIGAAWAIGRDTHVGDTLVGIKGRVGFEAAAPMLIIKAHELLEKHNGNNIGKNNWVIGTGCSSTKRCTQSL